MQKTTFPIEIIINDDCSTDGTTEILKEYHEKFPDIIFPIYHEENEYSKGKRGILVKNTLPMAHGKYIALCEGDDYWIDPLKLEKQVSIMERMSDVGACFTDATYINEIDQQISNYIQNLSEGIVSVKRIINTGGSLYPTASLVFKSELLQNEVENFIPEIAGDEFIIFMLALKSKIYFYNHVTTVYRRWEGGVYSAISKKKEKIVKYKIENINGYLKFNQLSKGNFSGFLKAKIANESLYIVKYSKDLKTRLKYLKYLKLPQLITLVANTIKG